MRIKVLVKSATVIASVALGVLLGRALVGRAVEPAEEGARRTVTVTNTGRENRITFKGYDGRTTASPKPGFLVVDAQATISSMHISEDCRWYLAIALPTVPETLVREFVYDHQAFRIEKGQTMTRSFYEEVPLPPGRYRVALQLRSYRPVYDSQGKVLTENFPLAGSVMAQIVE